MGGRGKLASVIGVLALVACGVFGAGSAWGAERLFDAELSLTGACGKITTADPVEDPGCPEGTHPGLFVSPSAIVVDSWGNFYVSSYGKEVEPGKTSGRIDVFSPEGIFLTEIKDPQGPSSLALDSKGNLYVMESTAGNSRVSRFHPTLYNPAAHEIAYPETPVIVVEKEESKFGFFFLTNGQGIAVDPSDDHLFVDFEKHVSEYSSAEEGNKLLNESNPIGQGALEVSRKIAIDGARRRLYASDYSEALGRDFVKVFNLDAPYELLETVDGSGVPPAEEFLTKGGNQSIAVDEETGDFFVDDIPKADKVYEFNPAYEYVSTYIHSFENGLSEIEVDNGASSPNRGALFVTSIKEGPHAYLFKLKETGLPKVEAASVGEVTEDEAELHARIDPEGLETTYRLEYVTQQQFGESLWAEAMKAGEGTLPAGKEGVDVSAIATELEPGTAYRFRVIAENGEGSDEAEGTFTTFAPVEPFESCENEAMRTALSSLLPDCRAFELVTPSDTGGQPPVGVGFAGDLFSTREASPLGEKVSFILEGGSIPGSEGTGAFNGDPYLSSRGEDGWITANAGPNGAESEAPKPGSTSADQGYSFWATGSGFDQGSRVIGGGSTAYVRYPNGDSELIGRGSLGSDPYAEGKFISENGTHIVFQTENRTSGSLAVQLEPDAPPDGTSAIYDRTADEVTHVVSLLPGDVTPAAKENATYLDASEDGEGIAFKVGGAIYVRLHDTETLEVAGPGSTFAGISEGGKRVFYVEGGDLFAFDTQTKATIPFSESGDVTPVNVATGGTRAYFVSPSVLTGEEENPNGEKAEKGEEGAQNLYLSEEGAIRFVGTVTERDIENSSGVSGLGLWAVGVRSGREAKDPSRTTPSGTTLLFESRADLTGYDPEGYAEIYRYDSVRDVLSCLSCSPAHLPAGSNASLQSIALTQGSGEPLNSYGFVPNLRPDGRRAIFQSSEALVLGDTDGLQDVYEWEEKGVGSCKREGGCVYLLSSGHSTGEDYLYGVSESGNDVFFRTTDLLTRSDTQATPSIYDARVGGGFPEGEICESEGCCGGESCRPQPTPPPSLPAPESNAYGPGGNVVEHRPKKPCPKGKRRVKRGGKVRCVKKHHRRSHK